jgi:hypothetical protein
VKDNNFIVRNSDEDAESAGSKDDEYGYGIGLDLVKHITEKLEWDYLITPIPGGREVVLKFIAEQEVVYSSLGNRRTDS